MAISCPKNQCKTLTSSACVFYEGESLLYTGITTNMPIETALQTLDSFLQENIGEGGECNCPDPTPIYNTVASYRSSFEESDDNVYAGYLLNSITTITRTINGNLENAINLTNLEVNWLNRLTLTYV